MTARMLLSGRCVIENYSKDRTKKTATSSYLAQDLTVPCRVLKREGTLWSPEKGTGTTMIRVRIALPRTARVFARDRIVPVGEGRKYEVIDILPAAGARRAAYKIAVCKAAGAPVVEE